MGEGFILKRSQKCYFVWKILGNMNRLSTICKVNSFKNRFYNLCLQNKSIEV